MTTLTVTVPSWVNKEAAEDDFLRSLKGKALLKMEFYRSRMKPFQAKYDTTFSEFQQRVQTAAEENFAEWDDLIEWEAYQTAFTQWEERYQELEKWFRK